MTAALAMADSANTSSGKPDATGINRAMSPGGAAFLIFKQKSSQFQDLAIMHDDEFSCTHGAPKNDWLMVRGSGMRRRRQDWLSAK